MKRMLGYLTALALCGVVAAVPSHAKEKARSKLKPSVVTKQATLVDPDGYRVVSPTLRCRQTLRTTLECKE
jgi:hypothetical protein